MSDLTHITSDTKEAAPMQLILAPTPRRRKAFLKHKYAESISIREIDPNRPIPRVTKIPATLQSGRARMLIIATKMMDRMERRLDMLGDADAQMTTKEYKEFAEGLEKVDGMMKEAFGSQPAVQTPISPVNNGIIINANAPNADLSRLLSRVTAKAKASPAQVTPHDTGRDSADNDGNRDEDGSRDD